MIGYIYKTTNKITNKIYIGQHKASCFDEEYIGSGKKLWLAVNKYGRTNFQSEIIEEIDDIKKLDEREIYWIAQYNATNSEIGYNMSTGGNTNRTLKGIHSQFYGKKMSKETREKQSKAKRRYLENLTPEQIERNRKGYEKMVETRIARYGRHYQSPETREKMRQAALKRYQDPEERRKQSERSKESNNRPEVKAKQSQKRKEYYERLHAKQKEVLEKGSLE